MAEQLFLYVIFILSLCCNPPPRENYDKRQLTKRKTTIISFVNAVQTIFKREGTLGKDSAGFLYLQHVSPWLR